MKSDKDKYIILLPSGELIEIPFNFLDLLFTNKIVKLRWDKKLKLWATDDNKRTKLLQIIDHHDSKYHKKLLPATTNNNSFNIPTRLNRFRGSQLKFK